MFETHLVTRYGPATLGHELLGTLVDVGLSSRNLVLRRVSTCLITRPSTSYTYHSQLIDRPGLFNVLLCLLQVAQLPVNHALGLLGALHSLCLECLDGLDLPSDIVRLGLESGELLLDLVDDGGVLKNGPVVGEVDGLGLLGEDRHFAARIVVALLEALEGGGGLALETKLGPDPGPVDFEGGAALLAVSFAVLEFCGQGAIARGGALPGRQLSYAELCDVGGV